MKTATAKPFYPFFFSIYPVLYLAAINIKALDVNDFIRPLILALLLCFFFYISFSFVLKNRDKAALVCTLIFSLFFSYGHVNNILSGLAFKYIDFYLSILWGIVFITSTYFILQISPTLRIRKILNYISGICVAAACCIIILGWSLASQIPASNAEQFLFVQKDASRITSGHLDFQQSTYTPDIYYIILDSYERADKLEQYYRFDNSSFINALSARGFYIADASRSNYLFTYYSVPSTLNMSYLNELPDDVFTNMTTSLKTNYVRDFLKLQGYTSIQFLSGDRVTDDFNADITIPPGGQTQSSYQTSPFEIMLAQTTLLHAFYNFQIPIIAENDYALRNSMVQENFDIQRNNIINTFLHLPDFSRQAGPHFIFAHIPSPHYPYVFGPNGERVDINVENYLLNSIQTGSRPYTDQMQYINQLTLQSIDRILAQSEEPPIIILQSDHGHDLLFNWAAPDKSGVDLRSANFTAIYYPDRSYNSLYASISPVNIFRSVFNHTFGSNFPRLADITFYHSPPETKPVSSRAVFYNACIDFDLCSYYRANINNNQ